MLEAALVGLPVITYEVGGISEHKVHGFALYMTKVGDILQLASNIHKISWNDDHLVNLNARNIYINENFKK